MFEESIRSLARFHNRQLQMVDQIHQEISWFKFRNTNGMVVTAELPKKRDQER